MTSYIHCPDQAAADRLKASTATTPDGVALGVPAEGEDGSRLFAHPFTERDKTALNTEAAKDGGEVRDTKPPGWREPDREIAEGRGRP